MRRCPICVRAFPPQERFCSEHGLPLVEERLSIGKYAGELSGRVLDRRYRLAGVAGRGGMGVVYEAENLRIGRRCAVKVLHPQTHADEKMRMRLFREVQATSRICHPNVVDILDYGQDEIAGSYLVMEFLEGRALSQVLRQAPLPLPFVLRAAVQLTAGLQATHNHRLIHRDLKPSNIRLLPSGRVKILDFGLVKPYERSEDYVTISTGGVAFGTPWYMSPEQAAFETLDPRSDIYSLGIIIYEMLVGRPPFVGDNPMKILEAQLRAPVPLPSTLDPPVKIPAGVEMVLLKTLAKKRDDRQQSMAELMDELYAQAAQNDVSMVDLDVPPDRIAVDAPDTTGPQLPAAGVTFPADLPRAAGVEAGERWTTTLSSPQPGLEAVCEIAKTQRSALTEAIIAALHEALPRYRNLAPEPLKEAVGALIDTAVEFLGENPPTKLPEGVRLLTDERASQRFSLTEVIGALWMGYSKARLLLKIVVGKDLERYLELQEQVDRRTLPFILGLIETHVAQHTTRYHALNEALAARNDELEHLRAKLADEMRETSSRLAEAERIKARVADVISSGLMIVERGTRELLMFNRAMERLTGLSASQVLGRRLDEMITFVEGVPFDEFVEQIRLHGEVGLRKLRLRLANGIERAVYVRGQAFTTASLAHAGTLFVVDDVTEREQIVESFSRYVSRDVVERVLRQGGALSSSGEPRRAALVAVNICDFRSVFAVLSPQEVVEYLGDYVRAVGDAVFHHGGTIDTVSADGILICFTGFEQICAPAVAAAKEIIGRIEAINERRDAKGKKLINAGLGIHVGDVLVLDVGGKARMVHTVIGEAAHIALGLRNVASPGEILLTEEVRRSAEKISVEPGPVVKVQGQPGTLEVFRLIFSPPEINDPITMRVAGEGTGPKEPAL